MAYIILLIFVGFLSIPNLGEAICCDSIKLLLEKKTGAYKTLCVPGNTLPPDCCKDIAKEVKKYVAAYEALCLNNTAPCTDPKPLGMESGKIPDSAITASSIYSDSYKASNARLKKVGSACSWAPTAKGSTNSWLKVDLGQLTIVTGIATQGSCIGSGFAKSYSISYSTDGNNWTYYQQSGNSKVFQANSNQNSIVSHTFKSPIQARYMNLWPKSWNFSPTMRLEYYGCRL